jgi:hypothetical protein
VLYELVRPKFYKVVNTPSANDKYINF